MDPVTIGVGVVMGVYGVASYMDDRGDLKNGDTIIRNEANREREAELQLRGGPEKAIQHRLHPQHQLEFVGDTTSFQCNACSCQSMGTRYSCNECNFDIHKACALSDGTLASLVAEMTNLTTFVHQHPLILATGSEYTCRHCNNKSCAKYRYYCQPCNMHFHLMCATHPTRLSSFLHPEHELELQTRHHFKKCSVCRHGKDSNARVYTCETCEFYVHPDCAVKGQYIQRPLHGDHTLVFAAVSKDVVVACTACRKKCKHWCYLCPACEDVYFHPECIDPGATGKGIEELLLEDGFMEEFADAFKEGLKEELTGTLVDGILNFVGEVATAALGG